MRVTERRNARGFLLVYVLLVVAILAVISMLLLESAENGAIDARQVEVKNASFDAAEAGLNAALEALDLSLSQSTSRSATLANGFHYRYHIHPNFSGSLPISIDDPGETSEGDDQKGDDGGGGGSGGGGSGGSGSGGSGGGGEGRGSGDLITLPPGGAVIVSVGAGPNGERVTTLEAAVTADVAQLTYPQYAIIAGLNIQGTYSAALTMPAGAGGGAVGSGGGGGGGGGGGASAGGSGGSSGGSGAGVHANGTITARVTRAFQTDSEASGTTNTLQPHTKRTAQVPLPMVSQFDYMVASYKNQASSAGGLNNVYLAQDAPLQSNYDCVSPPLGQSCLLFFDGPLELVSQLISFTGQWTMVVNGNLTMSGGAALIFRERPSLLIVNGNAYISGTGPTTAYLQVKGSTSLGGNVQYTGAIMSLGSVTFEDGSAGGFTYDPTVIPPGRAMVGLVKIISYAEY